jgi:hypothetical protein
MHLPKMYRPERMAAEALAAFLCPPRRLVDTFRDYLADLFVRKLHLRVRALHVGASGV